MKRNFFSTRTFESMDDARVQLAHWLEVIANARTHGTTHRCPREMFASEEKSALGPLPETRFDIVVWKQAKVHPDSHIVFEKRLYSVPYAHIGKQVWVKAQGDSVTIFDDVTRIATHQRRGEMRRTNRAHFPEHRFDYSQRDEMYWRRRAHEISAEVGAFVDTIFESDEVVSPLRAVQSVVTLLGKYPVGRADAACQRASKFGNYSYKGLKRILVNGLDFEPIQDAEFVYGKLDQPRFARVPQAEVH